MALDLFLFVTGFILLIKGADILVDGSSFIAKKFGVSGFFIGLTIVAFGTSAPELVISAVASFSGSAGIALGNIIGSNISNTLLILGASAIIAPLAVKKATVNKEIPFALLSVLVVGVLVNDFLINKLELNGLSRADGFILILFFVIFIYYTFGITREKENILQKTVEDIKDKKKEYSYAKSISMIIVGLIGLSLGGRWIVNGAISIAEFYGLSEVLIGLTIIAIGTSLPELATSCMAAYRGKTDIAVGNIVGSNIFNMFWVLGISSIIRPIPFALSLNADFIVLLVVTILLLFLIYIGKKNVLGKREGMVLITLYVIYLAFLVIRG